MSLAFCQALLVSLLLCHFLLTELILRLDLFLLQTLSPGPIFLITLYLLSLLRGLGSTVLELIFQTPPYPTYIIWLIMGQSSFSFLNLIQSPHLEAFYILQTELFLRALLCIFSPPAPHFSHPPLATCHLFQVNSPGQLLLLVDLIEGLLQGGS